MLKTIITILFLLITFLKTNAQQEWTLNQCFKHIEEHHPLVHEADYNTQIQGVNLRESNNSYLPQISAYASHGYNRGRRIDPFTNSFATGAVRSNDFSVSANWEVFSGFGRYYQRQTIKRNIEIRGLQKDIQLQNLKIELASSYLQVLLSEELHQLAQQRHHQTETLLDVLLKAE